MSKSFRVVGLDALAHIMIPLFRATYSTSNQSRIGERLSVVLVQLIQILQQSPSTGNQHSGRLATDDLDVVQIISNIDNSQKPANPEQKESISMDFDALINQKISTLIFKCLENLGLHIFLPVKMPLRDFLNSDRFFQTDPESLRIWGDIQTLSLSLAKTSLLEKYITKLNFSSLFMKKRDEEGIQIRALQRISFIIFAHEKDSKAVVEQIKRVLDKIIQVLLGPSPSNALLVHIFFALRIVLTRLNNEKVGLILQNIWPVVMITVIKIFDSEYKYNHDPNVQLAALKFLQFLQIKKYSNLFNHQWIITPDFYRVHISQVKGLGKFDNFRNVGSFSFDSLLSVALPRNHVLQYVIRQDADVGRLEEGLEFATRVEDLDRSVRESEEEDESDLSNLSDMTQESQRQEEREKARAESENNEDLLIDVKSVRSEKTLENCVDGNVQVILENYVKSRQDFVKISEKFLFTCLAINRQVFTLNQEGLEKLVFADFIDLEKNLDKFEVKQG